MKKILVIFVLVLFSAVIINTGCTAAKPVTDYDSLVSSLRDAGATVEADGTLNQPFFSVQGQVIKVNGEDVQVFEYPDEDSASQQAALVSPDGSTVGTTSVSWIGPPHFFRAGKIIVIYVGGNQAVTGLLEGSLGRPFAES